MHSSSLETKTSDDKSFFSELKSQIKKAGEETILIVDDDPLVCAALEHTLTAAGFEVIVAKDGEHALRLMHSARVAIIICDQKMPGLSGIDLLKSFSLVQPDAVRILLTGVLNETLAMSAVNEGKVYQLIEKPWDASTLIQTLKRALKQYQLVEENKRLQNLLLQKHEALTRSIQNLKQEIKVASIIHETLLLGSVPRGIPGITIAATTIPSRDIDGDFFDFFIQEDKIFDLAIGDVMGKGITASVVGTAMKAHLTRYANPFSNLYGRSKDQDLRLQPEEIVFRVAGEISEKLMRLEYFVCLLYGRFDLSKETFSFVDCGIPGPIHYSFSEKQAKVLDCENFPIGIKPQSAFQSHKISFCPKDFFVFSSDGVIETRSPDGEMYGRARLLSLVEKSAPLAPHEIIEAIQDSVLSFSQKDHYDDDLSLIVVKIEDGMDEGLIAHAISFRSELDELKRLRHCIRERLTEWHYLEGGFIEKLELAANEAFCNIVEHGYSFSKSGKILLEIKKENNGVSLILFDQGASLDPEKLKDVERAKNVTYGFGLYIIKSVFDVIDYEKKKNASGWNRLKLFKRYL